MCCGLAAVFQVVRSSRSVAIEPRVWVRRNKPLANLVFDEGRLDALLAVENNEWAPQAASLVEETKHDLGKLAFGDELHKVASAVADDIAEKAAAAFIVQEGPITYDSVKAGVRACLEQVRAVGGADEIPERRKVCRATDIFLNKTINFIF